MPNTQSNQITNTDFLNSNNSIVLIDKFKNIAFFTTDTTIPGVSMNHPSQPNQFANVKRAGDRLQFEPLVLGFKVNEDLSNWLEIYDWMKGVGFPESYQQYKDAVGPTEKEESLFSDISITILSNYKKPILTLNYRSCVPNSLSGISMSQSTSNVDTVICQVAFDFATLDYSRTI